MDDSMQRAALAAADRDAELGEHVHLPPESRSLDWEVEPGFPVGDLFIEICGGADEITLYLADFSDADECYANWTVFR